MASDPAAWMDEFRTDLHLLAAWETQQAQRLTQTAVYDQEQERRLDELGRPEDAQQFWIRFDAAVARHRCQPPHVRFRRRPLNILQCLLKSWPTFGLIAFLYFFLRHRPRVSGGTKRQGRTIGHDQSMP